jgi:glycosyltransferase involved in cell wall biosynthesis
MPFPSPQGTQALVGAMLGALREAGHEAHLLVYGIGAAATADDPHTHRVPHRVIVRPAEQLRSGPSIEKVRLDVRVRAALRGLATRIAPDLVVAHHVEAAIVVGSARLRSPTCMIAHAALGAELETYFPSWLRQPAATLGRTLDRLAVRATSRVVAVAPSIANALSSTTGACIESIPVPWPARGARASRREARARLRLPDDAPTILYAGNLDRYQGWETVVRAIAHPLLAKRGVRLVAATASTCAPLLTEALRAGVAERVHIASLSTETHRADVHGAADVAFVPRGHAPGLPIKLLDALSRGLPTIATQRATAGLRLEGVVDMVPDDDPDAAPSRVAALLDDPAGQRERAARGTSYLDRAHGAANYVRAIEEIAGDTLRNRRDGVSVFFDR